MNQENHLSTAIDDSWHTTSSNHAFPQLLNHDLLTSPPVAVRPYKKNLFNVGLCSQDGSSFSWHNIVSPNDTVHASNIAQRGQTECLPHHRVLNSHSECNVYLNPQAHAVDNVAHQQTISISISPPVSHSLQSQIRALQKYSRKTACSSCHTAKTSCNGKRPCVRCVRLDRQSECIDRVRKIPAGRSRNKKYTNTLNSSNNSSSSRCSLLTNTQSPDNPPIIQSLSAITNALSASLTASIG